MVYVVYHYLRAKRASAEGGIQRILIYVVHHYPRISKRITISNQDSHGCHSKVSVSVPSGNLFIDTRLWLETELSELDIVSVCSVNNDFAYDSIDIN